MQKKIVIHMKLLVDVQTYSKFNSSKFWMLIIMYLS